VNVYIEEVYKSYAYLYIDTMHRRHMYKRVYKREKERERGERYWGREKGIPPLYLFLSRAAPCTHPFTLICVYIPSGNQPYAEIYIKKRIIF
jgi:hypothetical protein